MIINQPFRLLETRVYRPYQGGRLLETFLGKADPQDGFFPENWIVSTTLTNPKFEPPPGSSNGLTMARDRDGRQFVLKELIEQSAEEMLGRSIAQKFGKVLPMLIKLLDTKVQLPVGAHPSRDFVKKHFRQSFGKTEAYYILETRKVEAEEPAVHVGFKRKVSAAEWLALWREYRVSEMLALLHRIPVKAGDCILVRAGTPHAIGAGIFMVELQEPSDVSVVTERERLGKVFSDAFQTMGMGFEIANTVFDFKKHALKDLVKHREPRARGSSGKPGRKRIFLEKSFFGLERISVGSAARLTTSAHCTAALVLTGRGVLRAAGVEQEIRQGDVWFLPACLGKFSYETRGPRLEILHCLPSA